MKLLAGQPYGHLDLGDRVGTMRNRDAQDFVGDSLVAVDRKSTVARRQMPGQVGGAMQNRLGLGVLADMVKQTVVPAGRKHNKNSGHERRISRYFPMVKRPLFAGVEGPL